LKFAAIKVHSFQKLANSVPFKFAVFELFHYLDMIFYVSLAKNQQVFFLNFLLPFNFTKSGTRENSELNGSE
jgi:hypothetical protein